MSSYLRRCAALGVIGSANYWTGEQFLDSAYQDYATPHVRNVWFPETRTSWVKFWAYWNGVEHIQNAKWEALLARWDRMIDAAHADGKGVILTLYTIPPWVAPIQENPSSYRFPDDVSTTGPWATWLRFLAQRYAGRVTAIEICNEPNGQMTPIYDSRGSLSANCMVAQMMQTADAIFRSIPGAPYIMAPATSDRPDKSDTSFPPDLFATAVLDMLDIMGWHPGPNFIWTHHTYWEIEQSYTGANSLVSKIRSALRGRWTGYGGPNDPRIWITEGGARLKKLAGRYNTTDHATLLDKQQQLFVEFWNRMHTGSEGAGVDMVSWYLFQTELGYDCGLCEVGDGTSFFSIPPVRPVYHKWGNRPYFP